MISEHIIHYFYPTDTPLRRMLIKHSMQVRDKALAILESLPEGERDLNRQLVIDGAMVHDIGIYLCDAPGILCEGKESYIAHGTLGARLIRDVVNRPNCPIYQQILQEEDYTPEYFESLARICERHTGAGLTRDDIISQSLPIPVGDYLPETTEEKLVCLADKFFSKSGNMKEKSLEHVKRSMMKFGNSSVERFETLCTLFHVK